MEGYLENIGLDEEIDLSLPCVEDYLNNDYHN